MFLANAVEGNKSVVNIVVTIINVINEKALMRVLHFFTNLFIILFPYRKNPKFLVSALP